LIVDYYSLKKKYWANYCSFFGINLTKPSKGLLEGVIDLSSLNDCIKENELRLILLLKALSFLI
jgi:hypothetical protein